MLELFVTNRHSRRGQTPLISAYSFAIRDVTRQYAVKSHLHLTSRQAQLAVLGYSSNCSAGTHLRRFDVELISWFLLNPSNKFDFSNLRLIYGSAPHQFPLPVTPQTNSLQPQSKRCGGLVSF